MDFLTKEEESHVRTLFNSSSSSSEDEAPKLPPKKRKISPEYTPQAGPSTAKKPRGGKRPGAGRPRGKKLSFEKGSPGGKRKGAGRKKFKSSNFSFVCMGAQKQKYKNQSNCKNLYQFTYGETSSYEKSHMFFPRMANQKNNNKPIWSERLS